MKAAWAAAFFLASAAASVSYLAVQFQNKERRAVVVQPPEPIPVKVAQARLSAAARRLHGSGYLRPEIEFQAISPFSATVKEILCKEGDFVSAGSVVAVVESKELIERLRSSEAALKRAHAALKESETSLAEAEKRLATMRELHQKDLIARREVVEAETVVETARAERDLAQSQVEQREAALAQVRYLVGLTRVSAPLSGVVTRRIVKAGDRVPAATPLVTIANVATLSVASELPALDSDRLQPGTAVQILPDDMPARPFSGVITRVRPAGSLANTRTVEIRVANQDGVLKPGLKVSVRVPTAGLQVVLVPTDAVFEIGQQTYLYTVDGDKARLRRVDKAWEKAGEVAITSNLTDGENVVISSRDPLQPDVTVRVID